MHKLTITEARNRFTRLADETAQHKIIAVTKRNRKVMALMSWELYEGLLETIEILADQELMGQIKRGLEDIRSGKTCSVEEARNTLGL
ncbi:MAG: hypothetical protein BA873_04320 [Desulfobulbaceae bacterium C00003063]|nr:MAG: hypothetical protein BA873_04320 [Desulfobulbaceae bacterium C00003063]